MPTVAAMPARPARRLATRAPAQLGSVFLTAPLAVLAVFLQGYHPYSEDGGLYLAGVKYLMHPGMFQRSAPFVAAHLKYSVFAPLLAALVRGTHLSCDALVLVLHLLCTWALLLTMWLVACECFSQIERRAGATLLCALWLGLPVAGTSLTIADPYLTARSFSTPCTLLALAAVLRALRQRQTHRMVVWAGLALLATAVGAAFHPLMAGYGLACALTLVVVSDRPSGPVWVRCAAVVAIGVGAATLIQHLSPPDPAGYRAAALTRSYWFLSMWQWYEWLGLLAPMALLAVAYQRSSSNGVRLLARMSLVVGSAAIAVSLLFSRTTASPLAVARLQPLRSFYTIYLVLALVLGGWLGGSLLRRRPARWIAAMTLLAGAMVPLGMAISTASPWVELPTGPGSRFSAGRRNPWVAAFLWIRTHTPENALVALDARYISAPKEDAQGFRALAERSSLPDYSKDGGEAAITPELATAWRQGVDTQTDLSGADDATRLARLKPLGVSWMVLRATAVTAMPCPYANAQVKVCRLE